MGVSLNQQETIIRYSQGGSIMEIYTTAPPLMRKLSNCKEYTKVREDRAGGKVIAMYFKADKKLLTLRNKKRAVRKMTAAEKEKARETVVTP